MSFKEWLPITRRNRVALAFAFAGLVMFVAWNCLPYYEFAGNPTGSIAGAVVWPELFDPDIYLSLIRSRDIEDLLSTTTCIGVIFKNELALGEERNRPVVG